MDVTASLNFNLICSTDDGRIADWIAQQLVDTIGRDAISAVGVVLQLSGKTKVLTVIKDPLKTPPYRVLELARGMSRRFCVEILETEVIGKVSFPVVLACAQYAMGGCRIKRGQVIFQNEAVPGGAD